MVNSSGTRMCVLPEEELEMTKPFSIRLSADQVMRLTGISAEDLAELGGGQSDFSAAKAMKLLAQRTFRADTRREEIATLVFALDDINVGIDRFKVTRDQMERAIRLGLIPVINGPNYHRVMPRAAYRFWREEIIGQTDTGGLFVLATTAPKLPAIPQPPRNRADLRQDMIGSQQGGSVLEIHADADGKPASFAVRDGNPPKK